jgi:TolA-binding protein
MTDPSNPYPRRLVEEDNEMGRLLRQANKEFMPSPAWINASLQRPLRKRSLFPALPVVFAGAACATAVALWMWRSGSEVPMSAEGVAVPGEQQPSPGPYAPSLPAVGSPSGSVVVLTPAPSADPALPSSPPAVNDSAEPVEDQANAIDELPAETPPAASVELEQLEEAKQDCLSLTRAGQSKAAAECFGKQAAGQGLNAEVGLYELARLRRDVLGDSAGALATLEEHRRRFPNGALSAEVNASYVSLLVRVGRGAEALSESERLLQSSAGAERAYELRLLRGNLLRKSGNLEAAQGEYAKAEQATGARADATYYNGVCLEGLGRKDEAVATYRRYLDRAPSGAHAADAKQRLDGLGAETSVPE